jgi:hypothetical protein
MTARPLWPRGGDVDPAVVRGRIAFLTGEIALHAERAAVQWVAFFQDALCYRILAGYLDVPVGTALLLRIIVVPWYVGVPAERINQARVRVEEALNVERQQIG